MRSVIDITDLTTKEVQELCDTAIDISKNPEKYQNACKHKKLASLFFEPSTRTRLSFEAAMHELGGDVLSVAGADSSSTAKGESMADTAKVVSNYADIIAIRHPREGAAFVAAKNASIPLINAGDGGHCHPTQTTADLLTIYKTKGRFDNLIIGLCGDLLYGRTVHSLMHAMERYDNVKFVAISPDELKLPSYMKTDNIEETTSLEEALPKLDILYMTRIQRERFDDQNQYERLKNSYRLTPELMKLTKPDCYILHPLPRVDEIAVGVDNDPRAVYFEQTLNGKHMRMALILKLLNDTSNSNYDIGEEGDFKCINNKCISQVEQELPQKFITDSCGSKRCVYCDN
ncbi:MAG: aspartate carbamoyltransferase [Coriobacteriia bacterium]|nr:aspartate carbamoyltransferase [Coriobacteriia bacterium]